MGESNFGGIIIFSLRMKDFFKKSFQQNLLGYFLSILVSDQSLSAGGRAEVQSCLDLMYWPTGGLRATQARAPREKQRSRVGARGQPAGPTVDSADGGTGWKGLRIPSLTSPFPLSRIEIIKRSHDCGFRVCIC